jgi:UPF0755 protein
MTDTTTTESGAPNRPLDTDGIDPMLAVHEVIARQRGISAEQSAAQFDPLSPDFEDPYYDPEDWERLPRRTSLVLRVGIIVLVVLLGGTFFYSRANTWLDNQIDPPGLQGDRLVIEIPSGATDSDVMRILADVGVISNSTVAQYWIRANDVGDFQAGDYEFRENSSFDEAAEVLRAGPLPPVFKRLTLPEGLWSGDMRNVMLDNLAQLDPTELDTALNSGAIRSRFQPRSVSMLEGLMFPATYQISEDESSNERAMIQRLVNTMDNVVAELGVDQGLRLENGLELSPYELIIVASMIEEEARLDEDRAKIARVIYNRLMDGEALGIDATTIYGVHLERCAQDFRCSNPSTEFSWYDPELTQSQLDDATDPYNSRLVLGLPPTPISSPGRASLNAALNPEAGTWKWYVLVDTDGRHFFTDSFTEFEQAKAEAIANGIF